MTENTSPYQGGGPAERLSRVQNFVGQHFQKQKFEFLGLFFQIELCFTNLNNMLNQCLDFSSLLDDFAAVKTGEGLF